MAFVVETESGTETPPTAASSLPHEEIVGNARMPTMHEEVEIGRIGEHSTRPIKDSTRAIIEAAKARIAGAPEAKTAAKTVEQPAAPAAAAPMQPAESTKPAGAAEQPKADPAPSSAAATTTNPTEPHADTVRANRLAEHNTRLVAELESLRKAPPAHGDAAVLKEVDGLFTTNPLAGVRKMFARQLGVPEDSKEITQHLRFLESDLTNDRIGVPFTEDSERDRKAARTLVAIQREMRERKAEETKTEPAPSSDDAESVSFVGNRLAATKHAENYPLLTAWGEYVHGAKPAAVIWQALKHGVAIGELDRNEPFDQLIDKTSKSLESYYQDLLAKAPKAAPTSTATTPAPATPPPEAPKGDPSGQRVPSLTSATTSAAPATMPATTPKIESFRNERERRLNIIKRHVVPRTV